MREQRRDRRPGETALDGPQLPADQIGRRARVLDEHMYRADEGWAQGIFRLQLFTATGLRPVAVATQVLAEGEVSLVNGCEYFASGVWREFFPDEPLPPLWVHRIIVPDEPGQPDNTVFSVWKLAGFQIGSNHELTSPVWSTVTQQQLDQLVGGPVDADRGSGFVPPPPPPVYRTRFTLVPMDRMPRGKPFRETCMTGKTPTPARKPVPQQVGWWRWLAARLGLSRQPVAVDTDERCCWYHGGDWNAVISAAVRLIAEVEAAGVDDDLDLTSRVVDAARAGAMSEWSLQALYSLLADPIVITEATERHPASFVNGQHRARAMRDAGVTAVLVGEDELVEPAAVGGESPT